MKRYTLALLVLLWAGPVLADTWEWVDSQGTVSFTDNLQNIPRQYRRSARKLPLEVSVPSVPDKTADPVPAPLPAESKAAGPGATTKESYGGKTTAQWQEAFNALDGEIRGVEQQLKEKQRLLKESEHLTGSEFLRVEDEFRQLSARRSALLARWESLKKEAIAARVPLEMR